MPQANACNGNCTELLVQNADKRIKLGRSGNYGNPRVKFCENCGMLKTDKKYCPCCKHRLRTRPKVGLNSKSYRKKVKPKFY